MRREFYVKKPAFPKTGKSGTQYDKESYEALTPFEKFEEGFIHDPDVVYGLIEDDIRYVDDYAQVNGVKVPLVISKLNMAHNVVGFTYRSDLVSTESLSVKVVPSTIKGSETATLSAKFDGAEVEATYTTESDLITISGSTVSVAAGADEGTAVINASYTKPAVIDEETGEEIEPAKEFTAKVSIKVAKEQVVVVPPTIAITTQGEATVKAGADVVIKANVTAGTYDVTVKAGTEEVDTVPAGTTKEVTYTRTATVAETVVLVADDGHNNKPSDSMKIKIAAFDGPTVVTTITTSTEPGEYDAIVKAVVTKGDGDIVSVKLGTEEMTPDADGKTYTATYHVTKVETLNITVKDSNNIEVKDTVATSFTAITYATLSSITASPATIYAGESSTLTVTVKAGNKYGVTAIKLGEVTKAVSIATNATGTATFEVSPTTTTSYNAATVTENAVEKNLTTTNKATVTVNAVSYALTSTLATIDFNGESSKTGTISNTLKKNGSAVTTGVTYEYTSTTVTVADGVVTADNAQTIGTSEATVGSVKVDAKIDGTVVATATVTVKAKDSHVITAVTATPSIVYVEGTSALAATGTTGVVVFTSSDTTLATISDSTLTAVKAGIVTVTATETLNRKIYTKTTTVTVKANTVTVTGNNPASASGKTTLTASLNSGTAPADTAWEITSGDTYATLSAAAGASVELTANNTEATAQTVTVKATAKGASGTKILTIPAKEAEPMNSYYGIYENAVTKFNPTLILTEENITKENNGLTTVQSTSKDLGSETSPVQITIAKKGYLMYIYPQSYGDLTTVKVNINGTWTEKFDNFTKYTTLTINGVAYNAYVETTQITDTTYDFKYYFK